MSCQTCDKVHIGPNLAEFLADSSSGFPARKSNFVIWTFSSSCQNFELFEFFLLLGIPGDVARVGYNVESKIRRQTPQIQDHTDKKTSVDWANSPNSY